ncbi:MAG TPA: class I poly(R)-hydroxyalkanoic acid synthase [Nitrosopumilaceae archaeon]|nr:class I poly(R)-hydroxyalkanoic acid synthase [Nitrosopumilaceae archaeon]
MDKEKNTDTVSQTEFVNAVIQANQRIIRNYLKNYSGYHHDIRDIALTYSSLITKILVNPMEMMKIYNLNLDFLKTQQNLYQQIFLHPEEKNTSIIEPEKGDKRFSGTDWNEYPLFNFLKQNYLLSERLSRKLVDEIEVDEKIRKKLDFYTAQYMDALSPSNFLLTNPEVLKLAGETNGKSLYDGFDNLVKDIENGRISQTDESAFEVGKNLATTQGSVIYENELMQLIQYAPLSKKVCEIPLVIIPPWINKYYILDLQPKNSLVKFLLENGITIFMVSWRNPKPGMGNLRLDDYAEKGAIRAIEIAQNISGTKKVNTLGYCLGGTLLSIACSILSGKQNENPVASASLLAAMVDFSNIGPMGDAIDGALIRKLERGELLNGGIMNGHNMETAFNLIRANDLIWNYVVNNYLKGIKPSAFDVLFWTNDNTNLPAKMYVYYMRSMILENKVSRKNALSICNIPIDIGKINIPVFVIGLKEDIISPARTGFTTTELVNGPVEFILGGSGHVMGVVNPPSKNKYGYYLNGKLGEGFEEWQKTANFFEGSWWTPWIERLINLSGKKIPAPSNPGNEKYKVLEPAPGTYVKEKC